MPVTTLPTLPANAVLLLIDLQQAVDNPSWGERNNPQAEAVAAQLLALWRSQQRPLCHVRHDSLEPASTYRPGQPGHAFKPEATPLPGEWVLAKQTNSAFIGTNLQAQLATMDCSTLVVLGVATSNSVEATVRMAGNLGYTVYLVEDACFTFGRADWSGRWRTASELHDMSLANLHGEYCQVVKAATMLAAAASTGR
ncbi:cysteine hydrolase family protein [Aquitalea aquatica]|uniref:Cysteine hydrolase n=1 Tax=Aquitalea aquatica TaxID=3044273 RepID=A0A838Y7E5_9NEIS|nr:cysteine hydrolase family protein [Aquitalea magnusonii]MBA4709272.1 cysteine hydrolase [Aquitalea magnusonii]